MSHSSCQITCSINGLFSIGYSSSQEPAPAWIPHELQCENLLQCAAGWQPMLPWTSPQAVGESLLWCQEHLFPLLLWPVSYHFYLFSHSCSTAFLHFSKYVTTEVLPALLIASALASIGSMLESTGTDSVWHEASSWSQRPLRNPSPSPIASKVLPHKTNITSKNGLLKIGFLKQQESCLSCLSSSKTSRRLMKG